MADASIINITLAGDASSLIAAVGQGEAALGRLEGSASKAGQGLQTALGAGALAAVAGLGAGLVGAVGAAMDFEKGLSAISAVSGATKEQLSGIREVALQLGKDTSFSAKEAAAGMEEMVKAGVSLSDVMGGAGRAALDLAAAGGLSVAESATIASNAMNVFSLKGSDMAHVADVIAGAANASAIDVHDFGFSLSAVGAVAATVGLGLEDTATSIAVLGQAGLKGSDAGTSLKTMLLNLNPASKAAQKEMRALGIITADGSNQFFDATGKIKSMSEVAQILQNSMKGLTKEEQLHALQVAFGTDAIRAAAIMAKAGAEGFDTMAESISKVTAADVAKERLNNLAGSLEQLKGSLETGAIILGGMFTPALKSLADMVTGEVNTAIDILEQLPDVIGTIKQVLAGEWAPDDSIRPFTNAVGLLAIQFRDNLLPAIRPVVTFITGTLIPGIKAILAPLGAFTAGFLGVVGVAGLASAAIAGVAAVLALLVSPLGLVAIAVGLLAAAWTVNFGGIQQITQQFVAIVQQALTGDIAGAFTALIALIGTTTTDIIAQLTLWGQAFVDWIAPMIPPMLAAVADLGLQLLGWIAAQIPVWTAQLALWGAEFVAWVAPQIPPLLAALADLGMQMVTWVVAQTPIWTAQLLLWGAEFVAWVAPQIPVLLEKLLALGLAMMDWITAQTPAITAKLVEWGLLFGAWILTTAIPELVKNLPGIQNAIISWFAGASIAVAAALVDFGKALVQGIYDGFVAAWATIGPKIQAAIAAVFKIPEVKLPAWLGGGGGGGPGLQTTSLSNVKGAPTSEQEIDDYIAEAFAKRGHDSNTAIRVSRSERSSIAAMQSGDSGSSFGPFQLHMGGMAPGGNSVGGMGDSFLQETGLDPRDISTWRQQVDYVADHLGQTGWSPFHAAAANNIGPRQGVNTQAPQPALRDMQRVPLTGGAPGASPKDWPGFMQQVDEQLPDYLTSLDTIQGKGTETFTTVGTVGATAAMTLVSTSTDALGNLTTIYSNATGVIGATITDAGGKIVNTWGTTNAAITEQSTVAAVAVPEQFNLMAAGALTSVTALGDGTLTTVQTMSGDTIATVTDMAGQVTNQSATLSNGVVLNMGSMQAGVLTSVTQMADGTITTTQDMAGNAITTVTDMNGKVTNQYVTMAASGGGAVTQLASTSKEQFGNVATAAQTMQADSAKTTSTMAKDTIKNFDSIKAPAAAAVTSIEAVGQVKIESPDVSGVISEMKKVEKAAQKAKQAVEDVTDSKGRKMGGSKSGDSNFLGKAAGGRLAAGIPVIVGDGGRAELFVPGDDGYLYPSVPRSAVVSGGGYVSGGGGAVVYQVTVNVNGALLSNDRQIEEAVVRGIDSAKRRGRM